MGCCYSHEEEDHYAVPERRAEPPRPVPVTRRPTPTATSSQSYYNSYNNQQHRDYSHYRADSPPTLRSVPVRTQVAKPHVRPLVIKPTQEFKPRPGALYGEYKCHCGYFWVSRLSWRDKYQQCKRCKTSVRPKNQRELRPTDFTRGENHPQELCEMCKQMGSYCGKYTRKYPMHGR